MKNSIVSPTFTQNAQGAVFLDENTNYVKGGILIPPTQAQAPAARSGTAIGISAPQILESPTDSWAEISSLFMTQSGAADIQNRLSVLPKFYSNGERPLSNGFINANHVFGTQQNPMFLDNKYTESILIAPQQVLSFTFANCSTSGVASVSFGAGYTKIQNKAIPSLKHQLDEAMARKNQIVPYWFTCDQNVGSYPVAGVTLAAAAAKPVFFTNKNPYSLILTSLMCTVVTGGSGDTEQVSLSMFEAEYFQQLNDAPVSLNCAAGNAQFPYRLPTPLFVEPGQQLKLLATSLNTSGDMDVFITFFGVAIVQPLRGQNRMSGDFVPVVRPVAMVM